MVTTRNEAHRRLVDANGKLIRRGDTLTNRYGWKMTIVDIGFTCCVVERSGLRFKIDKESIGGGGWHR